MCPMLVPWKSGITLALDLVAAKYHHFIIKLDILESGFGFHGGYVDIGILTQREERYFRLTWGCSNGHQDL